MIQHREHCAHKVVSIAHLLDLFPLCFLILDCVFLVTNCSLSGLGDSIPLFLDTSFYALNLKIAHLVSILVLLDKVLRFKNCSVRVHLDHIHVLGLALGQFLSRDDVAHIDDVLLARLCPVVEEDVLGVVVGLVHSEELCSCVRATACNVSRLVFADSHRAELLEGLQIALELLQVISDGIGLICIVDHVQMAEVLGRVALVFAADLDHLIDAVTGAIESRALGRIFDPEVLLILAAVHLDQRCAVTPIKAGVLTIAELVELVDDIVHIATEGVEADGELTLLLLHVHQQAEEGWDQVVLAMIIELIGHLALGLETGLLGLLGRVHLIVFFIFFLLLLVIVVSGHGAILSNAKLFTSTLGQR